MDTKSLEKQVHYEMVLLRMAHHIRLDLAKNAPCTLHKLIRKDAQLLTKLGLKPEFISPEVCRYLESLLSQHALFESELPRDLVNELRSQIVLLYVPPEQAKKNTRNEAFTKFLHFIITKFTDEEGTTQR